MPTVPVRASCVPLAGQAACIAALGSCVLGAVALGCGGLGRGVLTCAVCMVDVVGGRRRGPSTVTCGNGSAFGCCCAGVTGDGDAPGCVVGASCAGVAGCVASCAGALGGDEEGASCTGALGGDGDWSDCVVPCSAGGDAWARTSLAPAAASA